MHASSATLLHGSEILALQVEVIEEQEVEQKQQTATQTPGKK